MNNAYIRNNKSILSISLTRIILLLPMIFYGFYKNGLYLYLNKYTSIYGMFRPLLIIFGSAIIGALVNLFYEKIIKKNNDGLINIIFSSFHVEYGILLGSIMFLNVNLLIYFSVLFGILFLSKFIKNRINLVSFMFIIIYIISFYTYGVDMHNSYELSRAFSFHLMDYMIGKGVGGIASTHILFLILLIIGLHITNNNKTSITVSSMLSFLLASAIYAIIKNVNYLDIVFLNNFLFCFGMIATDSVTSCYTKNGMIIYGILVGLVSFSFYLVNPIIAPTLAILIVSLFNVLIDKFAK